MTVATLQLIKRFHTFTAKLSKLFIFPHILCFLKYPKIDFYFNESPFQLWILDLLLGCGPLFSFYLLFIGDVRQKRVFTCHSSVSTTSVMHLWIMKWAQYRWCYSFSLVDCIDRRTQSHCCLIKCLWSDELSSSLINGPWGGCGGYAVITGDIMANLGIQSCTYASVWLLLTFVLCLGCFWC